MKKLLVCVVCMLLLTGCWDSRELIGLGIVEAIAVDQDPASGRLTLTVELVRPSALSTQGSGGTQKSPYEILSAQGRTVYEAMTNLSKESDRQPFYAHTKILIFDEQSARTGLTKYLDVFAKSQEVPNSAWVVVAKGQKASRMLEVENGLETVQASYLQSLVKSQKDSSEARASKLIDFLVALSDDRTNPTAGVMEIEETPEGSGSGSSGQPVQTIKLAGAAVFQRDKLVGYLNDEQTKGLNWITGEFQAGSSVIEYPGQADPFLTIRIYRSQTTVRPVVRNGQYTFVIDVKERGNLVEQQGSEQTLTPAAVHRLETLQQNAAKAQIEEAIRVLQTQCQSDVLDFGADLDRSNPQEWNRIKSRWKTIFPTVRCEVNVTMLIRNTELGRKPIDSAVS